MGHHRRGADDLHSEWQHPHHPSCAVPPAVAIINFEPVRAIVGPVGHIRWLDAAVSSCLLHGKRTWPV